MDIILIVTWGICGLINLIIGNISRFSYGCVWLILMLELIKNVVL